MKETKRIIFICFKHRPISVAVHQAINNFAKENGLDPLSVCGTFKSSIGVYQDPCTCCGSDEFPTKKITVTVLS